VTPGPDFTGSTRARDGVALVTLAGELDIFSAPQMVGLLQEAIATGSPSVVVDMSLVSFCDARGLGSLVRAADQLRATGAQLSIQAARFQLRRLIEITGLTEALHVEPATTAEGLLVSDLQAAARRPLTRTVLDASLKLVVVMSKSVIKGADGVSITLPRDGRLRTVAASNDVVLQMDHDQYDTGQGPCLDAATHGELFSSTALASEDRWPLFVPRARARGIESIMSTPVMCADHTLGALNVYSSAPEALASHEQEWATQFAREAANVLLAANPTVTAASVDAEILQGLRSREVIALAQGVIMSRENVQAEAAHRYLMDISRRTSQPVLEICQELLHAIAPDRSRGVPKSRDVPGERA
jgi:anti-anti-sigma factor